MVGPRTRQTKYRTPTWVHLISELQLAKGLDCCIRFACFLAARGRRSLTACLLAFPLRFCRRWCSRAKMGGGSTPSPRTAPLPCCPCSTSLCSTTSWNSSRKPATQVRRADRKLPTHIVAQPSGPSHPYRIDFQSSINPQQGEFLSREWKNIAHSCPETCRLVLAASSLRSNQALKMVQRVCDDSSDYGRWLPRIERALGG